MGGKDKTTTSSQTVNQDLGWTKRFYEKLAFGAENALANVPKEAYAGNFVAPASAGERQGAQVIGNAASSILPQLQNAGAVAQGNAANYANAGQDVLNLGTAQARGDFLDANNPVLKNAISAAVNPLADTLSRERGRLENTASAQGAGGNSRVEAIRNRMYTDFTRNAGDVTANLVNNWYGRERQLQQNAPNLIAQATALEGAPQSIIANSIAPTVAAGQTIGRAGELERSFDTLQIQNALAQFQEAQTSPWRPYYPYAQLLGAIPSTTQTTAHGTNTVQGQSNPLMGALQGALGGASAGSAFGPWGAGIGAGLGGILGGIGG